MASSGLVLYGELAITRVCAQGHFFLSPFFFAIIAYSFLENLPVDLGCHDSPAGAIT